MNRSALLNYFTNDTLGCEDCEFGSPPANNVASGPPPYQLDIRVVGHH